MKKLVFGFLALLSCVVLPLQREAVALDLPLVNGIVRRVDSANSTATIRHDAIPNLNMGPMTMTFTAARPSLLEGLSPGDRIRFTADEVGGVLTLISVERL